MNSRRAAFALVAVAALLVIAPVVVISLGTAWATFVASEAALIMATGAAGIAVVAYGNSVRNPKLRLEIKTWMAQGPGPFLAFYEDDHGTHVSKTRPLTEWMLVLHNDGNAPARHPVVYLKFANMTFGQEAWDEWRALEHIQPFGWSALQWIGGADKIIYPGLPHALPRLDFKGAMGFGKMDQTTFTLSWTLAADGFGPETITQKIGTWADDKANWQEARVDGAEG